MHSYLSSLLLFNHPIYIINFNKVMWDGWKGTGKQLKIEMESFRVGGIAWGFEGRVIEWVLKK